MKPSLKKVAITTAITASMIGTGLLFGGSKPVTPVPTQIATTTSSTSTRTVFVASNTKPRFVFNVPPKQITKKPIKASGETYFAEIDSSGVVTRVIVADQAFINSGSLGKPTNWKKINKPDGTVPQYAGKGFLFDRKQQKFMKRLNIR